MGSAEESSRRSKELEDDGRDGAQVKNCCMFTRKLLCKIMLEVVVVRERKRERLVLA